MASHLAMQKLAQNPAAVVTLAKTLLQTPGMTWTEWELDFLEAMVGRDTAQAISTRQREKLMELSDDAKSYSTFDGLSVAGLVRGCWTARLDLSDDDADFINDLKTAATTRLKRRPLLRLLRCARELELIHGFVEIG